MSARRFFLCSDPIGLSECTRCIRNPEHPSNETARDAIDQQRRPPMTTTRGCGDWMPETRKETKQ